MRFADTRQRPGGILHILIPSLLLLFTGQGSAQHTGLDYPLSFGDLPYFTSGTTTWQNSSRDPSGANSDGLGCERWLYHDGEYVIMDEDGPGCIEDIWMTSIPQGNIRIYFDHETTPRVDLNVGLFFSGSVAPFVSPLVGNEDVSSGGYYCKVPLAYEEHVKVTFTQPPCYWHILWNRYPVGTATTTFTNGLNITPLVNMMNAPGTDPKPTGGNVTQSGSMTIPTGQGRTIFTYNGAGSIASLKLTPQVYDESVMRNLWVSVFFDGAENAQIQAPIGLLFGCGTTRVPVNGLPIGITPAGQFYIYYPMPFWQSVRIDLYNGRNGDVNVPFEVQYKTEAYGEDAGYFCARYKQEQPTTQGLDYLILETDGTGHYMGTTVLFTVPGTSQGFLEGDERIYVDGSLSPQVYGTGTEDYFEGGYYFNRGPFTKPLHGMPYNDNNGYNRYNMYRFHLGDRIPFTNHIRVGMEHGGVNEVDGWYSSVAYYYWKPYLSSFTTDVLDVGNAASESAHDYTRIGETWSGSLSAQYEGDFDTNYDTITDDGRRFQSSNNFDLQIAEPNRGAFVRRRTDQGSDRQRGAVTVNGSFLTEWDHLYYNGFKRWADDTLFVPPDRTQGAASFNLEIHSGDWNEFRYAVKSLVDVTDHQSWEAESLAPVSSNGRPYVTLSMDDINWQWGGSAIAEYQSSQTGDNLTLRIPVSEAGWYAVWTTLSRSNNTGVVQISINSEAQPETTDLYDAPYRRGPIASPGRIQYLNPGDADVRFEVIGKNSNSSGYRIRIDSVHLARLSDPPPPSPTPTGTPPTPTPSPTKTPVPPSVLYNGDFEGGFDAGGIANNWTRFYSPGYDHLFLDRTDIRHSGSHAQGWQLPVPTQDFRHAGLYQSIPVTPGHQYRVTAWSYSIYNGPETNSYDNILLRLGVDPLGDTAFGGGSVQYAEFNSDHNQWQQATVTVTAVGNHITVFLDGWRKWRSGVDDAWAVFDDVTFTDLTPTTPTPTPIPVTPTATPSQAPTHTPTPGGPTPTPSPTVTSTPTITPTSTPISGVNLLSNPGFEQSSGSTHPSWTHSLYSTNGFFPAPPNGTAFEGAKWASYSYGGGATSVEDIYQSVSVIPGHTYHVSAQANPGGTESGAIVASLRWVDGSYNGGGTQLDATAWTWPEVQPPWIHLTGTVNAGGNTLTVVLRADISGWGAGVNFDDVRLIDITPSTPTPTRTPTGTPTPTSSPTPTSTATPTPTVIAHAHWELR